MTEDEELIVNWLRSRPKPVSGTIAREYQWPVFFGIADAIERGERREGGDADED